MDIEIERPVHTYLSYSDFICEAEYYAKLNVIWISLFSGCGIHYDITDEKLIKLLKKGNDMDLALVNDMLTNIKPVCAVFSHCNQRGGLSVNRKRYLNSLFRSSNEFQRINLLDQAYSIAADIKTAKILYNEANSYNIAESARQNKMTLALLLYKISLEKAKFICINLTNDEGLFFSKEYHVKEGLNKFRAIASDNELSENAIIMDSLIELSISLDDIKYPVFQNIKYLEFLSVSIEKIFKYLMKNSDNILKLPPKHIIQIINSLLKLHDFTYNYEHEKQCFNMIIKYCAELQSKLYIAPGNSDSRQSATDIIISFKAIKTFINSYLCTGIEKFKECALTIYNQMDCFYDHDSRLYFEKGKKKYKFYCDEICSVINGLYWVSAIDKADEKAISEKMASIFEVCFDKCRIMLGTNLASCSQHLGYGCCSDNESVAQQPEDMSLLIGRNLSEPLPVFCSSIKFKMKKDRIISYDSYISLGRASHAALELLEVIEALQYNLK